MPLVFHLIFHTHWDREWYLPEPAFRARLVGVIDDVLDRLEQEPGFRSFLLDGQTILVEDYLRVRPDREAAVCRAVATGRLQVGPWYVLADEQIPSGESMIRNLLAGRADAERLGFRLDVLYSPDAFGHPAMLPDLAHEFGLSTGVLWRGLGDTGGDLARWRGPAGSELLLYHLPPAGYEIGAALPGGDATELAKAWPAVREAVVPRAATRHVALFVGADHHRAHAHPERLGRLLAEVEPEHEVRISRLDEFLSVAALEAAALPAVEGELRRSDGYTWALQGALGTRAPLKRRNAALEVRLERLAEPLVALAGGPDDLSALLDCAWRLLLANQFHDAICGTAADAVAVSMSARFADVDALVSEVSRRALHRRVGHDPDRARDRASASGVEPRLVLWNPVPRARAGIVIADISWFRRDVLVGPAGARMPRIGPAAPAFQFVAADGRTHPVQVLGRRYAHERLDADRHYPDQDEVDLVRVAFEPGSIDGLAVRTLGAKAAPSRVPRPSRQDVRTRGRALANDRLTAAVTAGGALSLTDHQTGERYEGLLRLESELDAGDTYTWAAARGDRLASSRGPVRLRALAAGPYAGVIEGRWSFAAGRHPSGRGPGQVGVRLVLRLHRASSLLHCTLEVDNGAIDHRLRLRCPTGLSGTRLITGAQFGFVAREPVTNDRASPREAPVATAPAHRVAAASVGPRGIAILMPGFFEVEWTGVGDLVVTALRALGQLSRGDLPTRPGHAGWPTATPLAQCLGVDRIDFALSPISAVDLESVDRLAALWDDAFLPVSAWWLRDAVPPLAEGGAIQLEGSGLVVSAIKRASDGGGLVLRCYNTRRRRTPARWRFGTPRATAVRVRADEREPRPAPLADGGRALPFEAGPVEWVTHLVR